MTESLPLELQLQVNKRLTLNLLVQGAATHAFLGAHHVAAKDFNRLNPEFLGHYDKAMVTLILGHWIGALAQLLCNPQRYFRRLKQDSSPFRNHRFMLKFGQQLADESRAFIFNKADEHSIDTNSLTIDYVSELIYFKTSDLEQGLESELEEIGKRVCSYIYGIDPSRLHAELTWDPKFGAVRTPKTWSGKLLEKCMLGWSAVERRDGRLEVVAKAINWPILTHELIKGTVELICLHGLTQLDDQEFEVVMDQTEQIELELPMMQIGGAFFRKFLAVVPRDLAVSHAIMRVAQMPPLVLDDFLFEMMLSPNMARQRLATVR